MPERISKTMRLMKGVPGIILVAGGGMMIYTAANIAAGKALNVVPYLVVGFGFVIAIAGIVLLFRGLKPAKWQPSRLDPANPASDIQRIIGQLGKNYDILREQTKAGFVLASVFMGLGILVILAGSAGQVLGITEGATAVMAVAGVIVEAVSVLGFYLFRTSFKELTETSERLHGTLLLLDAFKRAEALPKEQKTEVMMELINKLVEYGRDYQSAANTQAA